MPATPAASTTSWNTIPDPMDNNVPNCMDCIFHTPDIFDVVGAQTTNETPPELDWYTNTYRPIELGLETAAIVLGAINLVLGAMSWMLVPAWRQFRNYVFLNIILSGTMLMAIYAILLYVTFFSEVLCEWCYYGIRFFCILLLLIYNNWTLVGSVMFYSEIVAVFERRNERRYFLANVVGWLLPLGEFAVTETVVYFNELTSMWLIICFVNCIGILLYFKILYVLVTSKSYSSCEICQKVVFSMLILFASSASISIMVKFMPIYLSILLYCALNTFCLLNLIATNIFFLLMKSHRQLWTGQCKRWKINTI